MKFKFVLSIVLFSSLFSCNKSENNECTLPECIQNYIDLSSKQPFETVKMQKVDGECYYWLNTGAMAYDGVEFIVDENCDSICYIGGFAPAECIINFSDDWEIIWEP
ncbi:MAG: hypothetical protein R2771_03530 [Saprospiraceae bacterium]